jgi:hypothetical protein
MVRQICGVQFLPFEERNAHEGRDSAFLGSLVHFD